MLKDQRQSDINKYIYTFQMTFHFLLMILLVTINESDVSTFESFLSFQIILTIGVLGITFLGKLNYNNDGKEHVLEVLILCIYILIIIILIYKADFVGSRILLFVPAIIITIKYGKKIGAIINITLALLLLTNDLVLHRIGYLAISLETSLIIGGLVVLVSWLIGSFMEIEKAARDKLTELAEKDGLTDLINHRKFHDILEQYIMKNDGTSLSLIMLDLDHFKIYNDSFGHQKGDEVLREAAEIIKRVVNDRGIVARYGGDEFAVLLPNCDLRQARKVAEGIKITIENTNFYGAKKMPNGRITISQGIAAFPVNSKNKEELIQVADDALYKAKFVSREGISVYQSIFETVDSNLEVNEKELIESLKVLLRVLNAKDRYTFGHSERVMELALNVAKEMNLSNEQMRNLKWAALFHDIGKIEIPREVLNKHGRLTQRELKMMTMHPVWGADIISANNCFHEVATIIKYHHENFDGTGYPMKLTGRDTPMEARILRVADSYDAMITKRSYKSEMSPHQALAELKNGVDTLYDEHIVGLMCKVIERAKILDL